MASNHLSFRAVVVLALVLFQFGCGEPSEAQKYSSFIETQQKNVANHLKDPSSAQFRAEFVSKKSGSPVVCGEVNSKNSFGAYAGFQRYVSAGSVQAIESEMPPGEMNDLWEKVCRK